VVDATSGPAATVDPVATDMAAETRTGGQGRAENGQAVDSAASTGTATSDERRGGWAGDGGTARTDATGRATPGPGSTSRPAADTGKRGSRSRQRGEAGGLVSVESYVRAVVAGAPELSGTQIQQLRDVLAPGD
jgi:hypothetical protein